MKYFAISNYLSSIMRNSCLPVKLPLAKHTFETIKGMEHWVTDSCNSSLQKRYHLRPAIGIAANQVGSNLRMFYILVAKKGTFFINPKIIEQSVEKCFLAGGEGCLSVINQHRKKIIRNRWIKIKYYNYIIDKIQIKVFWDTEAIVIQHEIDHLNGIIYLDRAENQFSSVCAQQITELDLTEIIS